MSKPSPAVIRADHVGSLLRPESLRNAYRAFSGGGIDRAALHEATDKAVTAAVTMQEDVGLRLVTDGEFRRAYWFAGFVESVSGIALEKVELLFHGEDSGTASWLGPVVRGKLHRSQSIVVDDFAFLKTRTGNIPKVTMPTPSAMHFFGGSNGVDRDIYPSLEELFSDLAAIYRQELADLHAAGCRYLQLDEVPLALLCDPVIRDALAARGESADRLVGYYIDAINMSLHGRSADMLVAMHLCRGNYRGRWMASGGYDPIAERLFNEIAVDAFLLEFDSERAGTFEPLRYLPAKKRAFLGLISTKTDILESADVLRRRLDEAFRYASPEQLGICPQCGFASSVGGNPIAPEAQRAKLQLTVDVARLTWGSA